MGVFWKNAILIEEIGVDDQDGDDEPKGFQERLQNILYCCLWGSLDWLLFGNSLFKERVPKLLRTLRKYPIPITNCGVLGKLV
jgi:hypothetical protein